MINGDLEASKEKVRKAFKEYADHCPHSNEIVPIRAEQYLNELLSYIEDSHGAVKMDYLHLGQKIEGFSKSCDECRENVMKKDDLFKHGDFYVKERMKVAVWVLGAMIGSIIALLIFIFTQQFNSLKVLTDLSIKMDKRLYAIEQNMDITAGRKAVTLDGKEGK